MARPVLRCLLAVFFLCLSVGALADGHPRRAALIRPLQVRLAQADLVIVAEVVGLSDGRIDVAGVRPLWGAAPDRFQIKRRRSSPPPLAVDDRALLLLRGARAPYVLVDEPAETVRLVDARGEKAWSEAVQAVLAHPDDPSALAARMLGWIDRGPAALRDTALVSLGPLLEASESLRKEVALERADAAARSDLPREARAISAQLAAGSEQGQDRLVAELARAEELEATSLAMALRFASLRNHTDLASLYHRALRSEHPELRRIAAQDPNPARRLGESATSALTRIAADDPDELVQKAARKTLNRLRH